MESRKFPELTEGLRAIDPDAVESLLPRLSKRATNAGEMIRQIAQLTLWASGQLCLGGEDRLASHSVGPTNRAALLLLRAQKVPPATDSLSGRLVVGCAVWPGATTSDSVAWPAQTCRHRFALRPREMVTMMCDARALPAVLARSLFCTLVGLARGRFVRPRLSSPSLCIGGSTTEGGQGRQRERTCGHCPTVPIFTPVGRDVPSRGLCSTVRRRLDPDSGAQRTRRCLSLLDGRPTGRAGRGAFSRGG
uniref:Uncharacterized protein n=1 Tax=Plectus sambesii TaxID=2011161 RepID=A0A914VVE4_9BILA